MRRARTMTRPRDTGKRQSALWRAIRHPAVDYRRLPCAGYNRRESRSVRATWANLRHAGRTLEWHPKTDSIRGKRSRPSSALRPTRRNRDIAGRWPTREDSSIYDGQGLEEGFRLAGCEEQATEAQEEISFGREASGAGAEAFCRRFSKSKASRLPAQNAVEIAG